nr:hypothetical protein [Tanacetum cinerariifolium]
GQTINLNSAVCGHESNKDENNKKKNDNKKNAKKCKRKPGGGIGKETAKCWKYFDLKMEQPDGPDRLWINMAHYVNEAGEGCSSGILQNWKYDEKAIKNSLIELIVLAELPFKFVEHLSFINAFRSNHEIKNAWLRVRHLMENDCIPEENEGEKNTPIAFLIDSEKEDKIKDLVYEVETKMGVLFALYNEKYGTKLTHNSSDVKKTSSTQSCYTTRQHEPPLELDGEEDFDILLWWKLNSPRFPIVSKMAKDILSIQISIVAFESAFSTSGRVLDPYRNALSPQIIEALICTQSWVCTLQKSIYMDDLEDLLKDEDVIKEMQEALDKLKGGNGNGKGILLD